MVKHVDDIPEALADEIDWLRGDERTDPTPEDKDRAGDDQSAGRDEDRSR